MSIKHDKNNNNFNEEDEDSLNKLNINEEYAERFKHNEKRKEMEKNRIKYGNNFRKKFDNEDKENEEELSPEESEDSEGELDNEIVRDKFINTLLELKDEKESKKLIENKTPIFTDEDFKQKREKIHKKEKNEKIEYGIKDALLDNNEDEEESNNNNDNKNKSSDSENNIYSVNYKPKKIEEDETEKNEFISAANKELNDSENSDNENNEDFFDNGLLIKKKTYKDTFIDINEEEDTDNKKEKENKNETPEEAEEKIAKMTLSEALKKSKIKTKNVNMNLLEQIWGDDKKLSKNERFLRNYILSEGWLDKNTTGLNKNLLLIDKEDEENEDKFDAFENKYNHRYEEEGGANITTYQRNIDSYRHKDDTRAIKRKEHEKRKEEEKKKFKEELKTKKLKQAEEIKNKINKLEKIAGTEKIGELLEEFENKDFNMDEFDQKMNEIFDKEYYNKELDDEEIEKFDAKQERHLKLEEKEENENNDENENNNENIDNNDYDNYNNEDELWFYCDSCKKPLKEGKIKYECKTCEDYTLCKKCYKKMGHEHQMKKNIVPAGCVPPENAQELIEKVENEAENKILKCSKCQKLIVENRYYICNEESCKNLKFCKTCRGLGKHIHDHKLYKFIIKENEESDNEENKKTKKEKLQELIDEKANYTIDDVIDGQLGTKFHYTKVIKEDSGLTDDMLLLLDDKILNKYLPLKKITAYNNYKMPEYKKKIMLNRLEKLVNKKKKELANEYEAKYKNEKENEKLLLGQKTKGEHNNEENIKEKEKEKEKKDKYKNKHKKNKNEKNKNEINEKHNQKLSTEEYKKQKRLETYGITE